jgi:hypothetical protein
MGTVSTAEAAPANTELPPPLVKLTKHPKRWLRLKFELLVAAVLLAHIGVLIVVGLYYLLFEVNSSMTHLWHSIVSNSTLRHSIRDVGEGVLGGFLAQAIVWNHFKRRRETFLDRIEKAERIPQRLAAPFFALLYGVIGFVVAYYALHELSFHVAAAKGTHSPLARFERVYSSGWDKKITGFVASFFARRPMRPIFDSIQLWFAERRYDLHKKLRWYHPPTFKARYNAVAAAGEIEVDKHRWLQSFLMLAGVVIGLGLAGYGFYVLTYIARGG